jgi:hypothetical protein
VAVGAWHLWSDASKQTTLDWLLATMRAPSVKVERITKASLSRLLKKAWSGGLGGRRIDALSSPARQEVMAWLVVYSVIQGLRHLRRLSWRELKSTVGETLFQLTKDLPPVRKKLEVRPLTLLMTPSPCIAAHVRHESSLTYTQEEALKLEQSLEHSLRPNGHVDPIRVLPAKGRPVADILKQLRGFAGKEDQKVWCKSVCVCGG